MKHILPEFDFTVFDFETTGFSPEKGAEIIEVGAVKIQEGQTGDTFEEFVKPRRSLPPQIENLTGITPEDLTDARLAEEVMRDFYDYIEDSILVAHNASFDLAFLKHYSPGEIDNPHIDSLRLARKVGDFNSNALDSLVGELDISRSDAHRALDDALATAELFLHLSEKLNSPTDYRRCEIPRFIARRAAK